MNIKIDVKQMQSAAGAASDLLKALANPHRLMILCQLSEGERSVGELAAFLGIRDSTVSQHLAILRRDDLVGSRRDGQTIHYSISSAPARELVEVLYRSYCAPLANCRPAKSYARGKARR
jgi:DNA-binding transcriptional ArsR family regulator